MPDIQTLEKKFANYIGCDEAVSVNSGSAALELSLSLLNLKNDIYATNLSKNYKFNLRHYQIQLFMDLF